MTNENIQPPSFFKQLFCTHKWIKIGNLAVYEGVSEEKANLPLRVYRRWECKKCLKITKHKIL